MAQLVTIAWTGADGQTYSVSLDATTGQNHEATNTVTEHPVESGSSMSDHIRPDLDTLTLEGVITNTPLFLPTDHTDGAREIDVEIEGVASGVRIPLPVVGSLVGNIPITPTPKGVVRGYDPAFDRISACYASLLKLRNEGVLCRVITHLRHYDSMAIRRLGVTLDGATGHSLPLSLEFVQIRIGSTEEVPVPEIPRTRKDKGATSPGPPDADVSENASALFNTFG
jgi:hypothetical protein